MAEMSFKNEFAKSAAKLGQKRPNTYPQNTNYAKYW